jgi:hypothetical protein
MHNIILIILAVCMLGVPARAEVEKKPVDITGVFVGMSQNDLSKIYPRAYARTYRRMEGEERITFNYPSEDKPRDLVTFYFDDGLLKEWYLNDRVEVAEEYMSEFSSPTFGVDGGKIHKAIKDVLVRMPLTEFMKVTERRRPIIYTETWDSGTARFANSSEFMVGEDDIICCQDGFTLIKLSMGLNAAKTPDAIKGIVAHETAHRVFEHIKTGNTGCNAERQANALIKKWGFAKEFKEASELFGHQEGDPAPCQEPK